MSTAVTAAYRRSQREGADPTTEADATAMLLAQSRVLRRRLLVLTLAGATLVGAGVALLYISMAVRVYGRVIGVAFAVGGVVGFVILHRVSRIIAQRFEAVWADDLARRFELPADALVETLRMLD